MGSRYWVTWLPPAVAEEAQRDEPARFSALSAAVQAAVATAAASPDPNAWHSSVLPYIPTLNNFIDTHRAFALPDVVPLVHALLEAVLATTHDLETQVRTAQTLTELLRSHKRELCGGGGAEPAGCGEDARREEEGAGAPALVLPWRRLFQLVVPLCSDPVPRLEGVGLVQARQSTLTKLVATARRWFEPEAAFEVWRLLSPAVAGVAHALPDAYEAAGWVALFTPTHNICRCDHASVARLAGSWVDALVRLPACPAWSALWMGLLARLAKDDWKGVIDWQPHLPALFTAFVAAVNVPVGSADSATAVVRPTPVKPLVLHGALMSSEHGSGARLIVSLLRTCGQRPHTAAVSAGAFERLTHMAGLLDNYLHPSNSGKWCGELSSWLKSLVSQFMKQLGKQGPTPAPWAASLEPATRTAFVRLVSRLAARAMFSKHDGLSSTAIGALSAMAHVEPGIVLPLVVGRFRAALEATTATHQLAAAIACLGRCIRPLLLSGWGTDEETGPQIVAEAMMALLPGIDANDEGKTSAVMGLYTMVLACAPLLAGAEGGEGAPEGCLQLPLYVEDWAEDVAVRLLTLLSNLDSGPGHRADGAAGRGGPGAGGVHGGGGAAFLTTSTSFFPHLASLLFTRLPLPVAEGLARKVARFAVSETLAGVQRAVGTLLSSASQHHPQVVVREAVIPLLDKLEREVGGAAGAAAPSPALEAVAGYQVGMLREAVWSLRPAVLAPLLPRLMGVVDACLRVASRPVQDAGSTLLSAAVCVMSRTSCESYTPCRMAPGAPGLAGPRVGAGGCEEWVDKEGAGAVPPQWVAPTPEALTWVEAVIQSHLMAPARALPQLLGGGSGGSAAGVDSGSAGSAHDLRMRLHADLVKMKGVLGGLLSSLRDFDWPWLAGADQPQPPACVAGGQGPVVGAPGTREAVAAALAAVAPAVSGLDSESIGEYLAVLGLVLCNGSIEFAAGNAMRHGEAKLIAAVAEPAAAGLLLQDAAQGAAARPWRKRVPRWAAMLRLNQAVMWRCSQHAFRAWATVSRPELHTHVQLPAPFLALTGAMCTFATHPLAAVRAEAQPLLDGVVKRFPVAARPTIPHFLAALSGLPAPDTLSSVLARAQAAAGPDPSTSAAALAAAAAGVDEAGAVTAFYARLADAAESATPAGGSSTGAAAAAAGAPAAGAAASGSAAGGGGTQAEEDGRVDGAVRALSHCLSYWRLVFRDHAAFAAMIHALLASRVHNSHQAQAALSGLLVNYVSRFLTPPAMTPATPEWSDLAARVLRLAQPEVLRSSWRYSLTANVLALLLMPSPAAGAPALPFVRHILALLRTTMLPLRQLGAGGLVLVLTRMVEFGESNAAIEAEVKAWLAQAGSGDALAAYLAADHATLDAQEAARDKRGATLLEMQARLMGMGHDELLLKVVAASLDRLQRWPEGGTPDWQPEAVRGGLFVVPHARLVALLSALAPGEAVAALREPLERLANVAATQQAAHTGDKADQGAACEAMAGLLAAGAPFLASAPAGGDGAWAAGLLAKQLQAASLELSEAWAVCARFALRGLMDACTPPSGLHHLVAAGRVRAPVAARGLTPSEAQAGLGHVLHTVLGSGPTLAVTATAGGEAGSLPVQIKRLRAAHQCCRELTGFSPSAGLPPQVRAFWGTMLGELRTALDHDVMSLRQQLGRTMGVLLTYFGVTDKGSTGGASADGSPIKVTADPAADGNDVEMAEVPGGNGRGAGNGSSGGAVMVVVVPTPGQLEEAAHALAQQLVNAVAAATAEIQGMRTAGGAAGPSATVGGSTGAAAAPAAPAAPAAAAAGSGAEPGGKPLGTSSSASSFEAVLVDRPASPVAMETESEGNGNGNGGAAPGASSGSGGRAAAAAPGAVTAAMRLTLSRTGLALSFVGWAAFHGDLLRLRGVLLGFLPHLFRLQELAGPMLQSLDHEAKMAAALTKYVLQAAVVGRAGVPHILRVVDGAAGASAASAGGQQDLWSARAAALTYCQYFWFRSCFLMAPADSAKLQEVVLARLADPKPEVRAIAGATLSGMLRGMTDGEAAALRHRLCADARRLFSRARGSKAASAAGGSAGGADASGATLEKQGVVQGLKAYLQSSPYDCPAWMPEVLMALVVPASASHSHSGVEAAVRSAASKALSDFKRTHEQDSLAALRALMAPDDWDSLQQCTASASYFC